MSSMRLHAEDLYLFFIRLAFRYPVLIVGIAFLGVLCSLWLSATGLEFHTSHLDLVSSGNRYKQLDQTFSREFEDVPERVIVVIRSQDREKAKAFATALANGLENNPAIDQVLYRIPLDALQDRALWYVSPAALGELQHQLETHQELFDEYAAHPTLEQLFTLVNRDMTRALVQHVFTDFLADEKANEPALDLSFLLAMLRQLHQHLDPQQAYTSLWQRLFVPGAEAAAYDGFLWSDDKQLLFVLANPKVDAGDLNRFRTAVQQIRQDVRDLQDTHPDIEVGITGKAVLETDEMAAAQRDMSIATVISLIGVAVLFGAFFRGVVRPAITVVTLMIGLCWTLGLTTLTLGHLNIFTIVFAPMLIGLGIDSTGIHFLTHYEAERAAGKDVRQALHGTFLNIGAGIVTATLTTAIAFFALVLSDFLGLRELGFITGSGLLLILLATFTCLPALLVLEDRWRRAKTPAPRLRHADDGGGPVERLYRYPWATMALSACLVGVSLLALGRLDTDFNLLRLQSQRNESVIWAEKIFQSTRRSVLMGELMADSLPEVERKVAALSRMPSVEKVDSILSALPEEQASKAPLIQALRPYVEGMTIQQPAIETVDIAALQAALVRIRSKLAEGSEPGAEGVDQALGRDLQEAQQLIDQFLRRTESMTTAETATGLAVLQQALRRDLTDKLAILRQNLDAKPVTPADLPPALQARYIGKTGKFRLFVFPAENVWDPEPLARFVGDLQAVDRDALGAPVTNYEYMEAIKNGYKTASLYAICGIVFLTFLMFRGALYTTLALVPLCVGTVWTLGMMALFGVQFNMANLLFVPLIIGIGIDNGVHIMHSFRATEKHEGERVPLTRSTAKAISLAALTTIIGFGSLMISSHRGIYSLGLLVSLGVGSVLMASLTTLPSLLALVGVRSVGRTAAARTYREASTSSPMGMLHR